MSHLYKLNLRCILVVGKYNISILLIKYALCAVMAVLYIVCAVMAVLYIICAVMAVLYIIYIC